MKTYFTPCSSVSLVKFEQVNFGWVKVPKLNDLTRPWEKPEISTSLPFKRKLQREHVKETKTNKNQTRPKQKKKLKPKQPVKTTKKSFFKKGSNLTKERACPVRKENRIENQVNLIFLKYA